MPHLVFNPIRRLKYHLLQRGSLKFGELRLFLAKVVHNKRVSGQSFLANETSQSLLCALLCPFKAVRQFFFNAPQYDANQWSELVISLYL